MAFANEATCGIPPDEQIKSHWYRHYACRLVPMFEYRRGNEWNSPDFTFSWLLLRIWTLMTPQLAFGVEASDCGIFAYIHLPYLKIVLWLLPFPHAVYQWSYKHLWRTGQHR